MNTNVNNTVNAYPDVHTQIYFLQMELDRNFGFELSADLTARLVAGQKEAN